ncbi:Mur ligase, partial [Candidatus Saccharibacteria bacterium 32-49-10]
MHKQYLSTILGKAVKKAASIRGGGSALPGLVIERLDPGFMKRTLNQLPLGVVIISGTNGKTTTTKIVVELLESSGLKVFTNRTGSNFSRGVIAALLGEVDMRGRLQADIAVLELDEAWAAKFVQLVKPRYSLLLNVFRDQLDRFGEIDKTAKFLEEIARATTSTVVFNRDDPRIYKISQQVTATKTFFGTTTELLRLMPTDDGLRSGDEQANHAVEADVLLNKIAGDGTAVFRLGQDDYQTRLSLSGVYNILNAAAALALVKNILKDSDRVIESPQLIEALSKIKPAFGRGEVIYLNDTPIELILVKNPSGFRLALLSFTDHRPTMIAINDNYADGRDMSWLWDVDFHGLGKGTVKIVSGIRAYDMALRLRYD